MSFEVEGEFFIPDFKGKEKLLRAIIVERENDVSEFRDKCNAYETEIADLKKENKSLREELSGVRARFRNLRARIKVPNGTVDGQKETE